MIIPIDTEELKVEIMNMVDDSLVCDKLISFMNKRKDMDSTASEIENLYRKLVFEIINKMESSKKLLEHSSEESIIRKSTLIQIDKTKVDEKHELELETIEGVNVISLDGDIWATTISEDKALALYNLMIDHLVDYSYIFE